MFGTASAIGTHDGVADEMGEADLALTAAAAIAVDHLAVDLEQLGRDVAEACRGRHRQASFHVGGDGRTGAADGLAHILGGVGLRIGRGRTEPQPLRRRRGLRDQAPPAAGATAGL